MHHLKAHDVICSYAIPCPNLQTCLPSSEQLSKKAGVPFTVYKSAQKQFIFYKILIIQTKTSAPFKLELTRVYCLISWKLLTSTVDVFGMQLYTELHLFILPKFQT